MVGKLIASSNRTATFARTLEDEQNRAAPGTGTITPTDFPNYKATLSAEGLTVTK